MSEFPHVTDVLKLVRNMDWTPEAALERGRKVHAATALLDGWGDGSGLYYDGLHPVLKPYVDAYMAWQEVTGLRKWNYIEHVFVHEKYRYQGRLDRVSIHERIIVDIKCGGDEHPSIGCQLSAYAKPFWLPLTRLSLHLFPNGRFRVREWKDRADWPVFLGLLQAHQWRIRHGLVTTSRDTGDRGI